MGLGQGAATRPHRSHDTPSPALGVRRLPTVRGQRVLHSPPPFCRTTAALLGTTSSARSKSRTSRSRPRLAPSSRRPRRPRRSTRPRTSCRRRGTALSTSAPSPTPSPSSASPLRADPRCARAPGPRAPCAPRLHTAVCVVCHCWLSLALDSRRAASSPPARLCVPSCWLRIDHAPVS